MIQSGNPGDQALLGRLDRWSERSHWLPGPDERFPRNVFWGIFAWNFPILFLAFGVIGFLLYQTDPEPFSSGLFPWITWTEELLLGSLAFATVIDLAACLWLRRLWNRRAKMLNRERE